MAKKKKRYEVKIPVSEYWVMECYAYSKKEILEALKNGEENQLENWNQIYGISAPVGATKTIIVCQGEKDE